MVVGGKFVSKKTKAKLRPIMLVKKGRYYFGQYLIFPVRHSNTVLTKYCLPARIPRTLKLGCLDYGRIHLTSSSETFFKNYFVRGVRKKHPFWCIFGYPEVV
jgi:hypothetical protein